MGGWSAQPDQRTLERERLESRAKGTDATSQLQRCFPRWATAFEHLSWRALVRLAANEPVDPNDRDAWRSHDEHAQAVLRRHGEQAQRRALTLAAIAALTDGQARADRDAGLDWSTITAPASRLDERLRRAHAKLPDRPRRTRRVRRVAPTAPRARRPLGLAGGQADDLSRWVLAHPDQFDAGQLRCWRIASPTWLELAGEQLEAVDRVERPVGAVRHAGDRAARGGS